MSYPYGPPQPDEPHYPSPNDYLSQTPSYPQTPTYSQPPNPQPGYPQSAAGYPPQPGYGPPPGYYPPHQPGGGTAITAGVLALLGGLLTTVGTIGLIVLLATASTNDAIKGDDTTYITISAIVTGLLALLLFVGSIMMFARNKVGRAMVATGSGIAVLGQIAGLVLSATNDHVMVAGVAVAAVTILFPLITFICAIAGSTTRWLAYGKQSSYAPHPQAGYYGM